MIDDDIQTAARTPTLRSQVEDRLRAAILSGRFKPGQRLVERELCHMISVSRPSIREAIRQLEAEGLVVSQPYRGPSVSTITPAEARQLYTVRILLEGHAGEQFAVHGSDEAIGALGEAMHRLESVIAAGGEPALLIEAKSAFYAVLLEGAGNVFVRQTLAVLHNRVTLLRLTSMAQPGRLANAMTEIRAIHAAVVARDPAAAKSACERHVSEAAAVALKALEAAQA